MQDKVPTEETMSPVYAGIDVCKDRLDIHLHPIGLRLSLANDAAGHRRLARLLLAQRTQLAVMEPTSTYHRAAHRCLHEAGIAVALVNPLRTRLFAQALGRLAKSDPLDAAMLALVAERMQPAVCEPPDQASAQLAELAAARDAAINQRTALANRLGTTQLAFLRRELAAQLRAIERHIARIDDSCKALIAQDQSLAHRAALLRSIPGIGPVTVLALLAHLREIGRLNAKQVAALAGLAPFARDSGTAHPPRHIHGGRAQLRKTLYMAALVASRRNPDLARFYQNLKNNGKPPKLAIIAVARKLLVIANTIIAQNRKWTTIPA